MDLRFRLKLGYIGTKQDKSGAFKDQIPVHFVSASHRFVLFGANRIHFELTSESEPPVQESLWMSLVWERPEIAITLEINNYLSVTQSFVCAASLH